MKKITLAVVVAAISFASFASLEKNSWFNAGIVATEEVYKGHWLTNDVDNVTDPVFENYKLVLEDVEKPMTFQADEQVSSANGNIEIDSSIKFEGFDELPDIPEDSKGAITAVIDGDYYVAGYDADGETNKWFDTGIKADFDNVVLVKVVVTNCDSVAYASYIFGAENPYTVRLSSGVLQNIAFTGNGEVSDLYGEFHAASVPLTLPTVEGLKVSCEKVTEEIGTEVTVFFANDQKVANISSAKYVVQSDGTLKLKEGETEPAGLDPVAYLDANETIYATLEAALTAAAAVDGPATVTLCTNTTDAAITVASNTTLDLNGWSALDVLTLDNGGVIKLYDDTTAIWFLGIGKGNFVTAEILKDESYNTYSFATNTYLSIADVGTAPNAQTVWHVGFFGERGEITYAPPSVAAGKAIVVTNATLALSTVLSDGDESHPAAQIFAVDTLTTITSLKLEVGAFFVAKESEVTGADKIALADGLSSEDYEIKSESYSDSRLSGLTKWYVAEKSVEEDWPDDPSTVEGKSVEETYPAITNALYNADAAAVATWAKDKGVAYVDMAGILPEAFLLNCGNDQSDIDAEKAKFKIVSITFDGEDWIICVTGDKGDGDAYANGKVVIYGSPAINGGSVNWQKKGEVEGQHFFKAALEVKPYDD